MKCFALAIGARNSRRRFSAADDRLLQATTERYFPNGFTVMETNGGWFDPKQKRFIKEESRHITVQAPHVRALKEWCRELAKALSQTELLVIETGVARTFRFKASRNR